MKIYAIYGASATEKEPRCYVEAKDIDDLKRIMHERLTKDEPYGMFPGWCPVEINRKEMYWILNRFNENDIELVDEDKRSAFALFARMQFDDVSILEELRKYRLYKQKYSVNLTGNDIEKIERKINEENEQENLITQAINKRIKDLSKSIDSLQSLLVQPVRIENVITFSNNSDFEEISSKIPNERGIYFFTAEQKVIGRLYEAFKKAREKESKQGEAFAKLNDAKETNCIYVGSSNELRKRFEQHVKSCHEKTYAIKFYKWLPDEITIKFHYFCLEDIAADILQNIEEGIREITKPILGKSGKSSK